MRTRTGLVITGLALLAGSAAGCEDAADSAATGAAADDAPPDSTAMGASADGAAQPKNEGHYGPWGGCGPAPLAEPVPAQAIEVAEQAIRAGGRTTQPSPGFTDPTTCQSATLGRFYRVGTVDTRKLSGGQTSDDFALFYDMYRVGWHCDGRPAGDLEVELRAGRWEVISHSAAGTWVETHNHLSVDIAPGCTPGYLLTYGVGSWMIVADQTKGLMVHSLVSGAPVARTKEAFIDQLKLVAGR